MQPAASDRGRTSRFLVVLAYVLTAFAWIAFSDWLVERLLPADVRELAHTTKGFGFVVLTALGLWGLLVLRDRRLARGQQDLAESERRYRMLAERAQDVVYRYRYADPARFEYVSPSVTAMTGYTPEDHYRNPRLGFEIVVPEDLAKLRAYAEQGTGDEPLVLRWRRKDGTLLWTEHRVTRVLDGAGTLIAIEGAARDITARVEADAQHTLLTEAIEASPVGVGVMTGPDGGFEITYLNQAMAAFTGVPADQLVGRSPFAFADAGGPALTADLASRLASPEPFEVETQIERADGTHPLSMVMSPVLDGDGRVASIVTIMVDRTDAEARVRAESRLDAVMDASPLAMVTMDLDGTVLAWNRAAEGLFGWTADEAVGRPVPYLGEAGWDSVADRREALLAGSSEAHVVRSLQRRDGTAVMCAVTAGVIRDTGAQPVGFVALIEDLTAQLARDDWNAQLRRAIDQAAEAVVLTDAFGTITYVNPAFEQVSGYGAEELLGRNPRILQSGLTPARTYAEMWARLRAGDPWRGVLVNRRKDGSLYEEEVTISPVRSASGDPIAYVGVKRDLTLERRLAAGLSSELNDRAAVQEAMARIEVHPTPEATADSICEALRAFDEIDEAMLLHLPPDHGPLVPLAAICPVGRQVHVGDAMPPAFSTYFRERANEGPWAHSQLDRTRLSEAMGSEHLPPTSVAAPIRFRGRAIGVLVASTDSTAPDAWIARHLRVVAEIATHVGPLLGPQLDQRETVARSQAVVRNVLDAGAFSTVFQPVCDLATRQPVGWEALTRFDDAAPPVTRFRQAHEVGLGEALELACGQLAARTFAHLTLPGWLSINVSPSVVIGGRVGQLLEGAVWPVVLELTEHVPIEDYARLRGAIDLLEPPVMIAVDDAGAGYASLRHVLELRPDFVKLDLAFVHAIDRDPARQAMVAGMVHYASETNTQLIAEGVETEAERRTLLRLGVRFGQGYLLGMPSRTGIAAEPAPVGAEVMTVHAEPVPISRGRARA